MVQDQFILKPKLVENKPNTDKDSDFVKEFMSQVPEKLRIDLNVQALSETSGEQDDDIVQEFFK